MADGNDDFEVIGRITVDDEGNQSLEATNEQLDSLQGKADSAGSSFLDLGNISDFAIGGLLKDAVEGAVEWVGELLNSFVDLVGQGIDLAIEGIQEFIGYLGDAVDEAAAMQDTNAIIGATIKNLGQTTDETSQQMNDLADKIGQTTGTSHDAALAAEQIGLSYANLSSKIMPQYMQALTDMAAGTGRSVSSVSMAISRALEDPAASLSTLKRYGVTLTDAQQENIKMLEKSGDLAGAQAAYLKAIEGKFGGDAAAQAATYNGQLAILHDTFSQLSESVGNALLPALTVLVTTFHSLASSPEVEAFFKTLGAALGDALTKVAAWAQAFVGSGGLQSAFKAIVSGGSELVRNIVSFGENLVTKVIPQVVQLAQTWLPVLLKVFREVTSWAIEEGPKIWNFFVGMIAWVQKTIPVVEGFVGGIVNGIKSVIDFVSGGGIQKAAGGLLGGLGGLTGGADVGGAMKSSMANLMATIQNVVTFIKENGPQIMAIVQQVMAVVIPQLVKLATEVIPFVTSVLKQLSAWFVANGPEIVNVIKHIAEAFEYIIPKVVALWGAIQPVLQDIVSGVEALMTLLLTSSDDTSGIFDKVMAVVVDFDNALVDLFTGLINWILGFFGTNIEKCVVAWRFDFQQMGQIALNLASQMVGIGENIISGFLSGLTNAWKGVTSWLNNAVQQIENGFRNALGIHSDSTVFTEMGANIMSGLASGIKNGLVLPVKAITQVTPALQNAVSSVGASGASGGSVKEINFYITGDTKSVIREIVNTLKLQGIQIPLS